MLGEHCEDFVNQPLFDEYTDEEEEVYTSPYLEIYSDDLIYDTYEFESWEDHKEDDTHPILIAKKLSPFSRIDDKKDIYEPIFEVYKFKLWGYTAEKEICEKLEEQAHDQSIVLLEEIMQQPLISELKQVLGKSSYQFVDPIVDYMESSFSKVFVVPSFGKPLAHSNKYELLHTF